VIGQTISHYRIVSQLGAGGATNVRTSHQCTIDARLSRLSHRPSRSRPITNIVTQVLVWARELVGPAGLSIGGSVIIAFWLLWLSHRPSGLVLLVRIRW
jgi:hypothetical protein